MHAMTYADDTLRAIFADSRTIALVGASADPSRASNGVMRFLLNRGYRVIPVNPTEKNPIHGQAVVASLSDIGEPVDMVDVFRRSEAVLPIAKEAVKIGAKIFWTQLGVINQEAAALCEQAGMTVVMNRCPAIEIPRLGL
jgi:predicted CoA-binding protein